MDGQGVQIAILKLLMNVTSLELLIKRTRGVPTFIPWSTLNLAKITPHNAALL
jgi:hypothetical protein